METENTDTLTPDDRPITEQAAGLMDQLAMMEEMMSTTTFTDIVERKVITVAADDTTESEQTGEPPRAWSEAQTEPPPTQPFPTYRLD